MSGATPTKSSPGHEIIPISILTGGIYKEPITIVTEDGRVFTFILPDRMGTLPDDVVKVIFTWSKTTEDFLAFSWTCTRMHTISCNIPMHAFTSEPLCQSIFMRNSGIRNATAQFMDALIEEPMKSFKTDDEEYFYGPFKPGNPSKKFLEAKNTFYKTCIASCFHQNTKIYCENIHRYFLISQKLFLTCYKNNHLHTLPNEIDVKKIYAFTMLYIETYEHIINTCSDELNISVTFNTFKANAALINNLYKYRKPVDIEAALRNSLIAKHGATFQEYASQCLNAFPTSTIVAEMEQQLKAPLLAEKAAIEAELAILCGPNKFNGTINDAYMEMEALKNMQDEPADEAEVNAAIVEFNKAIRKYEEDRDHLNYYSYLLYQYPDVRTAYLKLNKAKKSPSIRKRKAAKVKFNTLVARLNTLAQWEEGTDTLIGGKLFEVCRKLEDISFISLFKVRQRGEFLAELACPVSDENKQVRFDLLLKFSDSKPGAP